MPETRARIEAAIEKLQFSVNAGARALATSRTMNLGVVVRLHQSEFSPALAAYLFALSDAARHFGYSIVLLTEADGTAEVRRVIAGRQVDGLILMNVVDGDPRLEPIETSRFPAVIIGMPGDTRGIDAVDLDFTAGARMLVDHLAERGHERALFLRLPDEVFNAGSTFAVRFAEAARSQSAERRLVLVEQPLPVEPEVARPLLAEMMADPTNPHALLIHNETAAAMLPFALHDLGLGVPADRSVVSLHSAEIDQLFALDFSFAASEPIAVSRAAVGALMRRLEAPEAAPECTFIRPELFLRGSVAAG